MGGRVGGGDRSHPLPSVAGHRGCDRDAGRTVDGAWRLPRLAMMQFRVLGPLEVVAAERRARLVSERRRAILAVLLAVRGEVVSIDRLVDAVWRSEPPPSAHRSLRSHVSRLRGELAAVASDAADVLVTEPDGYRMALRDDDLDAASFEGLVARARALRETDPAAAVDLFSEAEDLWRGTAFGELVEHEMVRLEAVRLEELRTRAIGERIEAQLVLGLDDEVIGELEARVAGDPLDEPAHGQLMLARYRSGRQAESLAAYRALQERLRDELGVDPSSALQELYERILRQDPDLAAPAAQRRPPRPLGHGEAAVRVHHPPLFGRDDDIRAVAALVEPAHLVTLTGPGGVGKTRLAERVAAEVAERCSDGIARVALDAVDDPDRVGAVLVGALELVPQAGQSVEETLVAGIGIRRLLLVLDNCEHVLASASQLVVSVLRRCPNAAVLATSREPLRLPGERVWQVAPLVVPQPDASATQVVESPAGALFATRAAAAAPGFALTDDNAPAVAELCRRLDGMPLAIELAAARVRVMAPADLLARLSDRFAVLTGGPPHEAGRHRTLESVVAWSYSLLEEAEARLFDRLSVFAGSFTLEAAEQVCAGTPLVAADVAGVLAELADKSMVTVERTGGAVRYRLLDTLRAFGTEQLTASGGADAYRRAHADHHVALAEALGPQVRGPDERAASAQIDATVDDLRAAHEWLLAAGDADGALRLPAALGDYIVHRLRDEIATWTERALELPDARAHPAYAAALATAAWGVYLRGDLDSARARAEAVLDDEDTDSDAAYLALGVLRISAIQQGRFEEALALDERAAAVAAALDDYRRASLGWQSVLAHAYSGRRAEARAEAARLESIAEASGNPTVRAHVRYCHGETLMDTDPTEAARHLETARQLARSVGSHLTEGAALVSLASLCTRQGQVDRALALFRDAVGHWRRFASDRHVRTALRNLVEALVHAGDDEAAARLHGAVIAGAPSVGVEAERLAAAWGQLCERMGTECAQAAAERGGHLTVDEAADEALGSLDGLLGG